MGAAERAKHTARRFFVDKQYVCTERGHVGPREVVGLKYNANQRKCWACVRANKARRKKSEKYREKAKRLSNMAKDVFRMLCDGTMGVASMREAAAAIIYEFGGESGIVGIARLAKAEFDAADEGSNTRRQYMEMIVKLITTLSLSGGDEDLEKLSDEEALQRLEAEKSKILKVM